MTTSANGVTTVVGCDAATLITHIYSACTFVPNQKYFTSGFHHCC